MAATGQKLYVNNSQTLASALALTSSNPGTIYFPTDAQSIVFNGKAYSGDYHIGAIEKITTSSSASTLLSILGSPAALVKAIDNCVEITANYVGNDNVTKLRVRMGFVIHNPTSKMIRLSWLWWGNVKQMELYYASDTAWSKCSSLSTR